MYIARHKKARTLLALSLRNFFWLCSLKQKESRFHTPLKQTWRHGGVCRGRAFFLFYFIFGDHLFLAGKTAWISDLGRKIPCNFSEDLFFFLRSPVFGRKNPLTFAPHLVYLNQTGINFSCPRAPLEFTQNKLLVPPQNLFLPPPSHAILAPGLRWSRRIKPNHLIYSDLVRSVPQ